MTLDDLKAIAALVADGDVRWHGQAKTDALIAIGAKHGRQPSTVGGELGFILYAEIEADGTKFHAQWSRAVTVADLPEHVAPVVDRVLDGARTEAA